MSTLRTVLITCSLLHPWLAPAFAAAPAAPAAAGACVLAAPAAPAPDHAAQAANPPAPQPARRINIDFPFDPCSVSDAERDARHGNLPALSEDQKRQEYDSWMAWNRSQGGGAPAGVWWFDTPQPPSQANAGPPSGLAALPLALRDGRHPWLAQGGALPAVPEPATYLLWLAGLGLLALAARRQNGISGGKGRPAARR